MNIQISIKTSVFALSFTIGMTAHAAHTITGLRPETLVKLNIERICIAQPFTSKNPFVKPLEPTMNAGVFFAEKNLDTGAVDTNRSHLKEYSNIKFKKIAREIKKGGYGSTDYRFKDFSFTIPLPDIEFAMGNLEHPNSTGTISKYIQAIRSDDGPQVVQFGGIFLKVDSVYSHVAFRGDHSNIFEDLFQRDNNGIFIYEQLWPRYASLLNQERLILAFRSGHVDPLEKQECTTSSFIEYSVQLQ